MEKTVKDPFNDLIVRRTDNRLRECDMEAPQIPQPLEIIDGKPEGWEAPDGDR